MPKFPIPDNEAQRLKTLSSYQILDSLEETEFNELVELASEICQTPVALISLVDEGRQWFKAKKGTDIEETPREMSFCAHAILNPQQPFMVKDARTDSRFFDNPLVTGDPNIVFYAGVPLISQEGDALGTLCVIDNNEHELSASQLSALQILAKQVMQRFEYRRKLRILEDAYNALLESNVWIQKFARTVAHDIKNPLSGIMLGAQVMQRVFEQSQDEKHASVAARSVNSCKQLINMVNDMLEYAKAPSRLLLEQDEFNLTDLFNKVTTLIDKPEHTSIIFPTESRIIKSSALALEQIFLNLLTNAIRYNDKAEIEVKIRFCEDNDYYYFKVKDNGIGIDAKFLERIFEEDFTTGLMDRFNNKGTGVGLHTVKALVEKLGGNISAESELGKGTEISFWIKKQNIKQG